MVTNTPWGSCEDHETCGKSQERAAIDDDILDELLQFERQNNTSGNGTASGVRPPGFSAHLLPGCL